jgi:hypothetical protein
MKINMGAVFGTNIHARIEGFGAMSTLTVCLIALPFYCGTGRFEYSQAVP